MKAFVAAATALLTVHAAFAGPLPSTSDTTTYHREMADGVDIFYREAGPKNAPTIVLLHGFPSSSREFDTLIPLLATRYHLIAPDFPSFGQSDTPSPSTYSYTFDHLARTTDLLLDKLKISRYSLYLHDYGAPVGFRIAVAHPERVQALIIQNGNAYKEGLGSNWAKIAEYWANPVAHPEVLDAFLSLEATRQRHTAGTSHPTFISRNQVNARSKRNFSTTTKRMWTLIQRGRRGCVNTSRRRSSFGGKMTHPSSPPVGRHSSVICRMPRSTFLMPGTSHSTRKQMRSQISS